jgi:uncharacterized protein (DUF2461 family)
MMKFDGINNDALLLLAENRFRDSRDFYEEHKELIKKTAVTPMRQIAAAVGERISYIDPVMCTDPVKMVSRIRRDTRYTKDQHLYRENMWAMFMRPKYEWPHYPCMWFEFTPRMYTAGIGIFMQTPALLEYWRKAIRGNTGQFLEALASVEKTGAVFEENLYKKPKDGCPPGLEKYYNAKAVWFVYASANLKELEDETIINKLCGIYDAFAPMYAFFLGVSDEYVRETGGVSYRRRR